MIPCFPFPESWRWRCNHVAAFSLPMACSLFAWIGKMENRKWTFEFVKVQERLLNLALRFLTWLQEHQTPRKVPVVEVKRNGGAFQPFHREQNGSANSHQLSEKLQSSPPTTATSCTTKTGTDSRREEKEGQTQTKRKQRRCWSPELHRRFLQALQQLGGSHGND